MAEVGQMIKTYVCVCVCVLQEWFQYDLTSWEQPYIIEQGFSDLSLLTYKPDNSLMGGGGDCPVPGRKVSSPHNLYPLEARATSPPTSETQKCLQKLPNVP